MPAVTSVGPAFVIETSASVVTESVSLAVVVEDVLVVELETVAVFVWSPSVDDGTVYAAVIVALPPAGIVPSEQVKFVAASQEPCDGLTVPCAKPAGQTSATETSRASDGPVFVTVIVYEWPGPPARTELTPSLFAIERSACVSTSVSVVLLDSAPAASVGELAEAVFAMCVPDRFRRDESP